MEKKKERVFIGNNHTEATRTEFNVMDAFNQIPFVESILKENDVPITNETIKACLTLRKEQRTREVKSGKFYKIPNGVGMGVPQTEQIPYDVFTNCDVLDEVFYKQIEVATEHAPLKQQKQEIEDDLRKYFDEVKENIYKCFHFGLVNIDTSSLLKYIEVKDGHAVLPNDIKERILKDTAFYATTEAGIDARLFHEKIAKELNEFADLIKGGDEGASHAVMVLQLFGIDENTFKIVPKAIDYDLFCK